MVVVFTNASPIESPLSSSSFSAASLTQTHYNTNTGTKRRRTENRRIRQKGRLQSRMRAGASPCPTGWCKYLLHVLSLPPSPPTFVPLAYTSRLARISFPIYIIKLIAHGQGHLYIVIFFPFRENQPAFPRFYPSPPLPPSFPPLLAYTDRPVKQPITEADAATARLRHFVYQSKEGGGEGRG